MVRGLCGDGMRLSRSDIGKIDTTVILQRC